MTTETTTTVLNSREEKIKFIQESVVTSAEAAEMLGVSYGKIMSLIKKSQLVPVIRNGSNIFLLKDDIKNSKFLVKSVMATLPDGTEIKAGSLGELADILQQTFEISAVQIRKLAKTGESLQPKWQKLEPLKGLTVKYLDE